MVGWIGRCETPDTGGPTVKLYVDFVGKVGEVFGVPNLSIVQGSAVFTFVQTFSSFYYYYIYALK